MFSAKTEKGPVTPSIVSGWAENLDKFSALLLTKILGYGESYTAKISPHMPVLNMTSIVPHA